MDFNERLRTCRKNKSLTQVALAKELNLTERQYQRLESGDSKPSYESLIALADFLDVSLDYLVGRSTDPTRHY